MHCALLTFCCEVYRGVNKKIISEKCKREVIKITKVSSHLRLSFRGLNSEDSHRFKKTETSNTAEVGNGNHILYSQKTGHVHVCSFAYRHTWFIVSCYVP